MDSTMTLEEALKRFPNDRFKVDAGGKWRKDDWLSIDAYSESLSSEELSSPAAIDDNHIAVNFPDQFEIVNLVPKSQWDSGN
jgi:hypothetical protein